MSVSPALSSTRTPLSISVEDKAARMGVSLLFLFSGILFATWVSRIPIIQSTRGLEHNELGLGLLGMSLGALLSMPTAGYACARFGSRGVCIISAIGYGLLLPVLAGAPDGLWFFLSLFLFGIVHGAIDVGMNMQAVEVENRYGRPIMSSFHALFSGGGLLGALLGSGFAGFSIVPLTHFLIAAALLLVMVGVFSFPHLTRRTHDSPNAGLIDHDHVDLDETAKTPAAKGLNRIPLQLVLIGLATFACMLGEGAMADWTAIYMREFTGSPEALAAISYAAFSVTMMVGRVFGDHLILRFGAVKIVRFGGFLATAGTALAILFPHPILALVGFAAVGAGLSIVIPCTFSAAGRLKGINPAFALSTVTTIGYSGFLLGPPAIGFLAHATNLRTALSLVVVTCFIVGLLAGSLRTKSSRAPA